MLAASVHLIGFPTEPFHQLGCPLLTLASVEFVQADVQLGPQVVELVVPLVEQPHGFAHHVGRIGEPAALRLRADAGLDVGREIG